MSQGGGEDVVRAQYERWIYPRPIEDLSAPAVSSQRHAGDPTIYAATFWPDSPPKKNLDVLVAGCGSNSAAKIAFDHREISVVGIDISEASLAHASKLKQKHGLENLTLHHCAIEDVHGLNQDFDLVEASGVLHHLAEPAAGLRALGSVLRVDGVVHAMVYGRYGRSGIYVLQDLFRTLRLGQTPEDIAVVKQTLTVLGQEHPFKPARHLDTQYDAGLVDLLLHPRDRSYTVGECVELVESAGMAFQGWTDQYLYYPEARLDRGHPLVARMANLSESALWAAMELLQGTIDKHDFIACRRDRDPASYRMGFDGSEFMDKVPIPRFGLKRSQSSADAVILELKRWYGLRAELKGLQAAVAMQIDGKRTVRECFKAASGREVAVSECKVAIRPLWRGGFYDLVHRSAVA